MKTSLATRTLIIASALLVGSTSFAQLTREQVKAELAAAIRSGDIATSQRSQNLNELYPSRYPAEQVKSALTREQVKAELAAAIRRGDIATGQRSQELDDLYPGRYPAEQVKSTLTREQVRAELVAALRTGDYVAAGEESGLCREVHPYMHARN